MRVPRTTPILVLALVASTAAGTAHQGIVGGPIGGTPSTPLWPVDEAVSHPEFFAFRARLQAAVARRDLDAVLAVVSPEIKNSFGGDDGIGGFMRLWAPRDPGSRLWEELATVLALGGTFQDADGFVAPYVFSRWPQAFDAFDHVALVAADVPVRAAPRADADVFGVSSFVVFPLARTNVREVEGWTALSADDRTGYVESALVRSPIDYRAFFERRDGRWQLVMFLAGD